MAKTMPHSMSELMSAEAVSRYRKGKLLSAEISLAEYRTRKRARSKIRTKSIKVEGVKPCNRRYFEFMGITANFIAYSQPPELLESRSKVAYEITDGLLPLMTVTSAREALIICASLAKYGIGVYFNQIKR